MSSMATIHGVYTKRLSFEEWDGRDQKENAYVSREWT